MDPDNLLILLHGDRKVQPKGREGGEMDPDSLQIPLHGDTKAQPKGREGSQVEHTWK